MRHALTLGLSILVAGTAAGCSSGSSAGAALPSSGSVDALALCSNRGAGDCNRRHAETILTTQVPNGDHMSDFRPYELGVKFQSARAGQISAIRYWRSPGDAGPHVGHLWSASGQQLAAVTFTNESYSGWQQATLPAPVGIDAATTYTVSVNITSLYPDTNWGLTSNVVNYGPQVPITNGDLSTVGDQNNGVFGDPGKFPASSWERSNYFRDIVFTPTGN
jgi:hypothetical protein